MSNSKFTVYEIGTQDKNYGLEDGFDYYGDWTDGQPLTDFDWANLIDEIDPDEAAEYAAKEENTYNFDDDLGYKTRVDAEAGGLYARAGEIAHDTGEDFDTVYDRLQDEDAEEKAEEKADFVQARDDAYNEGPSWLDDDTPMTEENLAAFCSEFDWRITAYDLTQLDDDELDDLKPIFKSLFPDATWSDYMAARAKAQA